MTILRASYPTLRDRFAEHVLLQLPMTTEWPQIQALFKCNGWMFVSDEWYLYASRNGLNFFPIYEHGGSKINAAAFGNDTYVFIGESGQILTSEGPDEYMNWNLEEQTPDEGELYDFIDICFDGTAFVVCGYTSGSPAARPYFQRALASDVTSWTEVAGDDVVPDWFYNIALVKIKSNGAGKIVAVGMGQGELELEWSSAHVIQVSDDHGETWTDVPYGTVPLSGESAGLTEMEVIGGRFVALSSEEEPIPGEAELTFIQSTDGETWEDISDRLVTPFHWEYRGLGAGEGPEYEHRSALMDDGGNIVVLLPGFDMQIGRIGASGPTDFERVPFARPVEWSEKGMLMFNGNYYIEGRPPWPFEDWEPAFIIMFTPHIPVPPVDLEWTPRTPPYPVLP